MIGGHFIKGWSKTQNSIALSSAEAELIAMAKLSAEALGLISLARDLGEEKIGKVWADSSAAIAIVNRLGAGKLRHIHIGSLWIQEVQKDRRLKFHKVAGVANCADLMTKNVARQTREVHMSLDGVVFTMPPVEAVARENYCKTDRGWQKSNDKTYQKRGASLD